MRKQALLIIAFVILNNLLVAQEKSNWSYDIGISFFKSSLRNQPDELLNHPVFERWESINHQTRDYTIAEYNSLEPYAFNLSVGFDALFRYRESLMIKIGYTYTNTLGIGGKGNITYTDNINNLEISESKQMSYSSHQLNYFVGPVLPINTRGAELYMGFSMMSPTYVVYKEEYKMSETGIIVWDESKTFTGFFGNCRSVIGMQIPLSERFKFGSEMVFAYFNGIELKSGDIADQGFSFPDMQWNFTFRYRIK